MEAILIESFDGGLQIPDLFEQMHILTLHLYLLFLLPEVLGRRFGLAEGGDLGFNLMLPLV